ncbi:MAG: MtrB/PioB family outer membrane beta-barrel protein [Candidatus Acidoferrales bacterium]
MKTRDLSVGLAVSCLLLSLTLPGLAEEPAPDPPPQGSPPPVQMNFNITLGGVIRDITNRHSSRFQYGRDVPEGFYLENFFFEAERPGRPWYFTVSGQDAGERDQHFRLTYERFGRYRLELRWDQVSLFVADNIQTLHTATGKGVLEVPDLFQTQFEAAPDAALPPLVGGVLRATPFNRLEFFRRGFSLRQEYLPTTHWRLRFGLSNEIRSGNRRISVGTYQRTNTPLGDTFFTPGIEVPQPIDYRTTEITAGASYQGERGFFRTDYRASLFRNRTDTLTMDNPFRITDAPGSRFRFQRTQVDLDPDNETHTISFLGGYSFEPGNTRLTGALSFSFWEQDAPFLPFTLNTAIVATNLPPGVLPTDLAALPQSSLNGEVTVISTDVALATRPARNLRLVVRYNSYNWNDNSDEILFPGYANSDSRWKETHGRDPDGNDLPILNRLHSFLRQRSGAQVIWKPRRAFSWKNEFQWEGWNRDNREIARTNEWIWKSQIILKKNWFYGKLNYGYGDRIPRGPYDSRKEFILMRKFDQAHRIRHNTDFLFQLTPSDQLIFSGSYGYSSNRYDERLYGLATYIQGFFTVDANYVPNHRFAGYVNFTRERYRSTAKEVAKTGAVDFNIPNTFVRDINDRVNSLGLGFDTNFLDHRLNWNVSYAFALSRVRIETFNPFTVDVASTLNATAFPFPDITENFHEVRTTLSYQVRENVDLGVRYLLEPRALDDFTTDIFLTPHIAGLAAPENNLNRWLFLNARQSSYHGHAAAIFLRYSF